MTLNEHLRAMVAATPPGSSVLVPREWLHEQLLAEGVAEAAPAKIGNEDLSLEEFAGAIGRAVSTARRLCAKHRKQLGAYKQNGRDWWIPRTGLAWYQHAQATGELDERKPAVQPARGAGRGRGPSLSDWRKGVTPAGRASR